MVMSTALVPGYCVRMHVSNSRRKSRSLMLVVTEMVYPPSSGCCVVTGRVCKFGGRYDVFQCDVQRRILSLCRISSGGKNSRFRVMILCVNVGNVIGYRGSCTPTQSVGRPSRFVWDARWPRGHSGGRYLIMWSCGGSE